MRPGAALAALALALSLASLAPAGDGAKDARDTAKDARDTAKDARDTAKDASDQAKDARDTAKDASDQAKDARDRANGARDRGPGAGDRAPRTERMKVGGAARGDDAAAEKYFTNTELIDQHGRSHRFYGGLLRGRKVLINFAFTSCKGACPTMTANLARVQELLRARGKRVTILTITVDPENDTPAALKQYAARFKAGDGWYFLTGTPANVAAVLQRLGGQTRRPDEHTMTLLVGDTSTGMWLKTLATERPETLAYLAEHINDPQ